MFFTVKFIDFEIDKLVKQGQSTIARLQQSL
jgi:hypothetical protein